MTGNLIGKKVSKKVTKKNTTKYLRDSWKWNGNTKKIYISRKRQEIINEGNIII